MKAAVVFIIAVMFAGAALAQDTALRLDNLLAPWMEMLASAVSIIIAGAVIYVSTWVRAKFGIDIEARHREALQTALDNGAGLVLSKVKSGLLGKTIDVGHPLILDAIQYVNGAAPDAVRNFGLGADDLAEKLVAKIGLKTANDADKTTVVSGLSSGPIGR